MAVPSISEALQLSLPPIHIVDVGAMTQGDDRYATLVERGLGRVTGFEPNAEQFQKLAAKQGPYRYLPFFLGAGGPATFHVTRAPGCSSLYAPDPAVIGLFTSMSAAEAGNYSVVQTLDVQTRRLDEIDIGPVDFLKLDVQGAEFEVLQHGTTVLATALVLECEVEFLPLYKGQPLFGDVHAFLAGRGFALHKIIDVAGRSLCHAGGESGVYAPLSQVLSADAIFVRDFTHLERFSDVELLKTAAILHEMYCSYDVALHFLREHDRRNGGRLAARYSETVLQQPHLPTLYVSLLATIADSFTLARTHHEAGRLDMAEQLYRQILQAEPTHVEALHLMGVLAGQAGRYAQAAEHLQAALRLRGDQPVILCNLGGACIGLGRIADAIACYQQALTILPEYPDAYYGLGRAWEAQKNLEQAAAAYRQALQLKPDHADARAHLDLVLKFAR